VKSSVKYPFTPKSNSKLAPGQFWSIPLLSGKFGCGRILGVPAFGPSDRVGVVVGLTDWVSDKLPTHETIAGSVILAYAATRFDTVLVTGGQILGFRDLAEDNLVEISLPGNGDVGSKSTVWGANTIANIAERTFALKG
jgi:hypothetical protein